MCKRTLPSLLVIISTQPHILLNSTLSWIYRDRNKRPYMRIDLDFSEHIGLRRRNQHQILTGSFPSRHLARHQQHQLQLPAIGYLYHSASSLFEQLLNNMHCRIKNMRRRRTSYFKVIQVSFLGSLLLHILIAFMAKFYLQWKSKFTMQHWKCRNRLFYFHSNKSSIINHSIVGE